MVMSQSLYKVLKSNHPGSELHVMAPAWCVALLERMPEVDKAIPMPLGHGDFKLGARRRLGKQLAAEQYDQAIIQPNSEVGPHPLVCQDPGAHRLEGSTASVCSTTCAATSRPSR
jgi:hypothetical protein